MKAIIKIDVPDFQIGQEVNIHFKDSMVAKGVVALSQEPCKDAISRQAAIGIIQNWLNSDTGYSWGEKNVMKCTIDELSVLPSVNTEKTGRWIDQGYKEEWWAEYYNCSECGYGMVGVDNYCPNCGAKMEVEE